MPFNFQICEKNSKKHLTESFANQFNLIMTKYLFNPITEIFFQSKNGSICSIHSWSYLFNPFESTFNPPLGQERPTQIHPGHQNPLQAD